MRLPEPARSPIAPGPRAAQSPSMQLVERRPAAIGIEDATLTHHLNRMENAGYISRHRAAENRRTQRVVLTDAGRQAVDDALFDLVAREHDLLATLPDESQAELALLLRTLVREFGD